MKIIKKGEEDKSWPREITAPCCKAVLEIEPDDIKRDTDYTGDFNGYFIDCPSCGGQPAIDTSVKYDADRWKRQQERRVDA